MRKATFTSHRFQINFGIAEENEEDLKAVQLDDDPSRTPQSEASIYMPPDDLISPIVVQKAEEWQKINTLSKLENGSIRRQTMPEIRISSYPSTPRRSSITNAAIYSSIGPSIASVFPGAPSNFLSPSPDAASQLVISNLRRSATFVALAEPSALEEAVRDAKGRRWSSRLPFFRGFNQHDAIGNGTLDENKKHHHHLMLPHLHFPAIDSIGSGYGRKFSFGIRRHSHTTLHRTDSMVSLCYRTLANYVSDDNLAGLQNFLENKRVQVDDRDENGSTALILSASKGKIHFVRELINYGADVNAEDVDNWTALLFAAKEGYDDVCLELLEHGADLEHRDAGGWSALMWASYKGRTSTVTLLLARNADVNAYGNYHISSLLWAAGRGYTDIVKELLAHGAKVNVGDKYGTTAIVWAARKGSLEIVDALLKAGSTVDTAGMYSWTPLIVATLGNHVEVVLLLLDYKPNVNAVDKNGCTALSIACREGFHEIANAMLNAGAYINIQDKSGDTNLIHAVKGGHRGVVESLLKKYADVDIPGKDRKTATYIAVEKGNVAVLRMLLNANPDLEIATKDGDTPLLRAVRSRNAEMVQMLLDKKAKVSASDKKGDTVLHIAMRARSKGIVEILLRNPKNSQLLYRPNKQGETPYNIDINHPKAILGQIFGARRLNTNEDNENMLGYDLYSSALADILSEPSLSTPITVGLYAKWGSGKSFLLNKLREEMKNFARQWLDPSFQFSSLLFLVITHVSLLIGVTIGLICQSWITGLISGASLVILIYVFLLMVWYANKRYDWYWPYNFTVALTTKLNSLKLLLQVTFCHPPGNQTHEGIAIQPIKFYFTDQTRVGTTTAGENAVVQMVGSLYDSIENEFGSLPTRLYRAFRPKPVKSTASWRWRHLCCLPYVAIFEFCFCSFLVGVSILTVYLVDSPEDDPVIERVTAHVIMISIALLLAVSIIANLYTWSRTLQSLVFSQRRQLRRRIAKLETLKSEGFLQTLRSEVNLMTEMVKCLDSFTAQKSRLVVIVDGLDSCEQDKVLLVLDAIQALFSDNGCPFVVILAIDPHIISKVLNYCINNAVEVNSRRLFTESNIGGHDYLRNMVHLPFYLQNSGLRKVKIAQQTALHSTKKATWNEAEESVNYATTNPVHRSVSNRRLSTESSVMMNSNEKLKPPSRKNSRKLKLSESIASSIGSNLNRLGGAQDLNKMLLTDDYFSDVNPRSMRRLLNVVYVTGRLLKAFQIDFNWYHLASWINITEQWPFRTSWMILYYDSCEDNLDDSMSLKSLYDKVRPQIPVLKDVQPLLEIDRDERKLDVFLTFHRSSLLVSDMKIFLPFTINLDPYIKKKIKEEQQSIDEEANHSGIYKWNAPVVPEVGWLINRNTLNNRHSRLARSTAGPATNVPPTLPPPPSIWSNYRTPYDWQMPQWSHMHSSLEPIPKPISAVTNLPPDILDLKLSCLTVDALCNLLDNIQDLNPNQIPYYREIIKENNITGRVLLHCDLQELKNVLKMSFGDWELFRMVIISLREQELTNFMTQEEGSRSVRFHVGAEDSNRKVEHSTQNTAVRVSAIIEKDKGLSRTDGPTRREQERKQSIMEKQVTLEEQMICGALQTLNEEACEDVLDVPVSPAIVPTDSLPGDRIRSRASSISQQDTDYVILQSNPLLHWIPVSDDQVEEDTSSDSSLDSVNLPPIHRTNSQRSISSRCSIVSSCSTSQFRAPAASAHLQRGNKQVTVLRPSSLLISPPSSPALRSKSDNHGTYGSQDLVTTASSKRSLKSRLSTSSLSEELTISIPVPVVSSTSSSGLSKLTKLKDRILSGSKLNQQQQHHQGEAAITTTTGVVEENSDGESTPLVSGMSSPSNDSTSDNVFKATSPEDESSDSVSPISATNKSMRRGGDHSSVDTIDHYVDAISLVVHESMNSSNGGRSLSRQNAQEWDNNPETPV
ncbi:kinase D-interacting substrate of 220 kDa B-like [Phymastichus coffea]|uniref:kinase D-interacting substrate of 220 kDa B-like n=1 Tax=Phymastichus coffea TaxID=108790 RepID=UPI00273C25D2|nr:kinase D-interacting substrate of 220 kDa B-like [Phymastichus coffea]